MLDEDSKLRLMGNVHLKWNSKDIRDVEKKSIPISSQGRCAGLGSADNKAM